MWAGAFALVWGLGRRAVARRQLGAGAWGYEMAVVQSFTAGSNNFVRRSRSGRVWEVLMWLIGRSWLLP